MSIESIRLESESNVDYDEERLFRSGIDSLVKAFNIRKENLMKIINEQDAKISRMELKIEEINGENGRLKNENGRLKKENEAIRNEFQQLKEQKMKLINSLEANQSKLQMIKRSIVENNSFGQKMTTKGNNNIKNNQSNNNTNSNTVTTTENIQGDSIPNTINTNEKQDMFQLYKKTAMITAIQTPNQYQTIDININNNNNNSNYLTMRSNTINHNHMNTTNNTTQPIIMSNDTIGNYHTNINSTTSTNNNINNKYTHIETRLNYIKGNLTAREINLNPNPNPNLNLNIKTSSTPSNFKSQHIRANSNHNSATNITKTLSEVIHNNTMNYHHNRQNNNPLIRLTTPSSRGNKIKEKILKEARMEKDNVDRSNRSQSYSFRGSNKYELTNQFLNECNLRLDPQDFEKILVVFQKIKEGGISEEVGKEKIKGFIVNNSGLMNIIESVFH